MAIAMSGSFSVDSDLPHEMNLSPNPYLDHVRMSLSLSGKEIRFTATEFKLLAYLLQNPNRVISRRELLQSVWQNAHQPGTRTVDIHIAKLRQKVEVDPARPVHFRTVHWAGYKFIPWTE